MCRSRGSGDLEIKVISNGYKGMDWIAYEGRSAKPCGGIELRRAGRRAGRLALREMAVRIEVAWKGR